MQTQVRTTLAIDGETYKALANLAKQNERSASAEARLAIRTHVLAADAADKPAVVGAAGVGGALLVPLVRSMRAAGVPPGPPAAHTSTDRAMTTQPTSDLRNALERVAVVVCELELGETSIAHTVASDLEIDLRAAVDRHKRQAAEPAEELREAA
jgi:uncharacterized protein YgbK (DUF1537 family)